MQAAELLASSLKLRQIIVVATIAQKGSIRETSAALHLTQPAISRTLAETEKTLGVRLFTRVPKGMTLTAEGQSLLAHMQIVVSEMASLLSNAKELVSGERGVVRVGTLLAGTADILPAALFEVTSSHPHIRVAVSEATPDRLHEDLMSGQIDLVVGRVSPIASLPGVEVEPLYEDEVHVVCSPNHFRANHQGSLAELIDEAWILPPQDTSLRQQIDAAFIRECRKTLGRVIECVAPVPLRALLARGQHLAVVPSGIFADDIERGALVSLNLNIEGTSVPVGIISRSGSELPKSALELVEALRRASLARVA